MKKGGRGRERLGAGKLGIAENVTIAFNLLHFSKLDDFNKRQRI